MFSKIRTLSLFTAIAGVMALFSPAAQATIEITRADVQWGEAIVTGRGAAAIDKIYWKEEPGEDSPTHVSTANKRGKFSFQVAAPSSCKGAISSAAFTAPIIVELSNCTSDSGEPGSVPELHELVTQPDAHNGVAVRAVGFASNGVGGTWAVSGGEDAHLRTWGLPSLARDDEDDQELAHTIYDLESSVDGSIVVTGEGGWNGGPGSPTLRILDASGISEETTAPIGFVYCVAISPGNDRIAASGFYGDIVVYDSRLNLISTKNTKKKRTKALAFSPDGKILASTSTAGRIQLWSFPELDLLPVSLSHGGSWAFPIAFAPYSESDSLTEIVSGSDGGTIKKWTIDFGEASTAIDALPVSSGPVYSLDWWWPADSENVENSMIVAGGDGDITVYDADSMEILFQTVNAHAGRINDVAFSPGGTMIVSGGDDGVLKLWDFGGE